MDDPLQSHNAPKNEGKLSLVFNSVRLFGKQVSAFFSGIRLDLSYQSGTNCYCSFAFAFCN